MGVMLFNLANMYNVYFTLQSQLSTNVSTLNGHSKFKKTRVIKVAHFLFHIIEACTKP